MIIRTSTLRKEFDHVGSHVELSDPKDTSGIKWRIGIAPLAASYFVAFSNVDKAKAVAAFDAICDAMEHRPGVILDLCPFEK